MTCLDHIPEPGSAHVGVDLGRGEVCVTQHGLDGTKIGSALQQIRCEGVAKHVG
jgi:hypothetical protein